MKKTIFCVISALFPTAAICLICDYCISQELSWSMIVLLSLLFTYVIVLILLCAKKNIVQRLLITFSVISFPYLLLLSLILHVPQICSLGVRIALPSVAAMWIMYALAAKYRGRPFLIVGFGLLVSMALSLGIVHIVARFNAIAYTDFSSDIFHAVSAAVLAGGAFLVDYVMRHTAAR